MKPSDKTQSLSRTQNLSKDIYATLYDSERRLLAEAHAYQAGAFRFSWNTALDISIVLKGELHLYSEAGVQILKENSYALINPNVGHAAITQNPETVVLVLLISDKAVRDMLGFQPIFFPGLCERCSHAISDALLSLVSAFVLANNDPPAAETFLRMILSLLRVHALEKIETGKVRQSSAAQRKRTQEILRHIDRNFRSGLSLDDIASAVQMNPSYLSTFFKQNTGLGVYEYITRKRLEYAVHLLNNTENAMLDISLDAGFSGIKPFYSAFQRYFHLSPGKYRSLLRVKGGSTQIGSSTALPLNHETVRNKLSSWASAPLSLMDIWGPPAY